MLFFKNKNNEAEQIREQRAFDHNERVVQGNSDKTVEDMYFKREMDKQKNDLVRWQQDLSEDATAFMLDILGYYMDDNGNIQDDPNIDPLANLEFVKRVKPLLRMASSRNFMMTNYSDERVRRTLQRAARKFADLIFFHYKIFDIDKKDFGYLVEGYQQLIEPTIYRGYNNGERNFQNTINKRIETVSESQPIKKQGLFG
jgi:hypothetical protein